MTTPLTGLTEGDFTGLKVLSNGAMTDVLTLIAAGSGGGFVGRGDGGAGSAGGGVGKGSGIFCAATACIEETVSGTDTGSTACVRSSEIEGRNRHCINFMASLCDNDLAVSGKNRTPQDA